MKFIGEIVALFERLRLLFALVWLGVVGVVEGACRGLMGVVMLVGVSWVKGVLGFASWGEARVDVATCMTLLVIDDDEVFKLRDCLARMDRLEMGGDVGKGELMGFKIGYCMSGRVCNETGGGEDTWMLRLVRSWVWGAGIGGWEGEVLVVGLGEDVDADAGGW